jgi:hypothetical protein
MESTNKVELVDQGSWTVLLYYVANRLSRSVRDYAYFITFY